jgi:hypothetical protein
LFFPIFQLEKINAIIFDDRTQKIFFSVDKKCNQGFHTWQMNHHTAIVGSSKYFSFIYLNQAFSLT